MSTRDHLLRAVGVVGSTSALARACGVSRNAVWKALRAGRVSAELAKAIETATVGRVTRSDLRPDLWEPTLAA